MDFHPPKAHTVVAIDRNSSKHPRFEKNLRGALEFRFQPIVKPNGKIIGAELQLCWLDPQTREPLPRTLFETIDDPALVDEISEWQLTRACSLIKKINTASSPEIQNQFEFVSVKIDSRFFGQDNFAEKTLTIIKNAAIDPEKCRLEIPEDVAIQNSSSAIEKMRELEYAGVYCLLDKFGVGYSSLTQLHQLPLAAIKIDCSLVSHINEHPQHQSIVDASVAMAEHMGKECHVDGIETVDDFTYFQGVAIDAMQGEFFPAAVDEQSFLDLLDEDWMFSLRDLDREAPLYRVAGV